VQETRLFDPDRGETRPMRSKEDAQDYRYFPDPDLLPLEISPAWIEEVRRALPPLPAEKREAYAAMAIPVHDAQLLAESREKSAYFDASLVEGVPPKTVANWVNGEIAAFLNDRGLDFDASPVTAAHLRQVLVLMRDGVISGKIAKEILPDIARGDHATVDALVAAKGLRQISDAGALEAAVEQVIAAQPRFVEDYRSGKEKAFNALVGQVMKATQGKANPQEVSRLLRARLDA